MADVTTTLTIIDNFTNTLNRATQGVERVVQQMRDLDVQSRNSTIEQSFADAADSISQSRAALEQFINSQNTAANGATFIQKAWGAVIGWIGRAISDFGIEGITTAVDDYTNYMTKLGLVNDGTQLQEALQHKVYQAAQRSNSAYSDMVGTVTKLGLLTGKAFKTNDDMIAFAEQANKVFAMSGGSSKDQQAGVSMLTKAMADGKLQKNGFGSIMENAPLYAEAISKFTGKSFEQLKEMNEKGTLTANILRGALSSSADAINAKFAVMPKTFGGIWDQIKEYATMKFSGLMQTISVFLKTPLVASFITAITIGIDILVMALTGLVEMIAAVGTFIQTHWSSILPILLGIGTLLLGWIYTIFPNMMLRFGVMIFQLWGMIAPVLVQVAAWMMLHWPITLIALLIMVVAALIMNLGATFEQVCGFIGGVIGGLYAIIFNVFADIWNLFASFAEFITNVLNDPVGSIVRLFSRLFDFVFGLLETIANAIDSIFGSKLAESLNGFRDGIKTAIELTFGEPKDKKERMDKLDTAETFQAGSKIGAKVGANISDKVSDVTANISSMFGDKSKDPLDKGKEGKDLGASGMSNIGNIGKVGEVGKIKDDVNIGEEDLQLMKDVAEMRYVQNFVTLTPTVAMNATISERVDVNHVMNELERRLENEFVLAAEGVYR